MNKPEKATRKVVFKTTESQYREMAEVFGRDSSVTMSEWLRKAVAYYLKNVEVER